MSKKWLYLPCAALVLSVGLTPAFADRDHDEDHGHGNGHAYGQAKHDRAEDRKTVARIGVKITAKLAGIMGIMIATCTIGIARTTTIYRLGWPSVTACPQGWNVR